MKARNLITQLVSIIILLGCQTNTRPTTVKSRVTTSDKKNDAPVQPAPHPLKVSAYLVYDDGSFSSFDVLNDKTKALWNTIIGAGDAERPSTSTAIKLSGHLDSLRLVIFNGNKKAIDRIFTVSSPAQDFIIKNTGCEIVKVTVSKNDSLLYQNNIEFHCGE